MKKLDVRQFVSKEVYGVYGENSWQFVSDSIVKLALFTEDFFDSYYKADSNYNTKNGGIDKVTILINNWASGGQFNNRGLRTVAYINSQVSKGIVTAMLSQHIGGSTNAIDLNIVIHYKNGKTEIIESGNIFDIIRTNEKVFMANGLTTLEDKTMTNGWTHTDCRHTGMDNIYIVPAKTH